MGHSPTSLDLVPAASAVCEPPAGVTARDVAAVLFRRRRIILAVFLAILGGAVLGVTWLAPLLSPPRFAAGLKFIIKKERFDALVTPGERSMPGLSTSVSAQEVYSEVELLRSADVLEALARQTGLTSALDRLGRDLVVEPVAAGRNLTNLIAVRYSATDPLEVRRVLEKLPDVYLEKHLSMNRRPAALEYFRSQAELFEEQLRETEEELVDFEKQRSPQATETNSQQVVRKLIGIEEQRLQAETGIREGDSRAGELERQLKALPATVSAPRPAPGSPYLERLKTELLDLENRRAQATFYRDIEKLDRRIEETRRAAAAEDVAAAARAAPAEPNPLRAALESERLRNQVQLAGLRARRTGLAEQERAAREQLAASRWAAAEDAAEFKVLTRSVKEAEENFALYRKKYADAREADSLDEKRVLNVAVAEGPRAPAPVHKRRSWFYLAIGFVLATVVAGAAGFGVEILDHSIHTPRQLEGCAGLGVLACVPEVRQP